jgi:secreted trypsin-like serine protease
MRQYFVALLLLPGLWVACQSDLQITEVRRPIYLGEPDTSAAHKAVVALVDDYQGNMESFCTGTLITPTVVLTAAHCLDDVVSSEVQIYFGDDVTAGGVFVDVSYWEQHPGWDPLDDASPDDMAVIRLAEAAPAGVLPISILPASLGLGEADEGIELDFSGFGETEDLGYDVKLHVHVPIDRVCLGPAECAFDGGWISPRAFGYTQENGGPCSGDSGGPAFIWSGAFEFVAGVTSYGYDCLDSGVSTTVNSYQDWIEDFAGITGVENCQAVGDDDGDGLADCADPDCADDPCCDNPPVCDVDPGTNDGGCNQSGRPGFLVPAALPLLLFALFVLLRRRTSESAC